MFDSSILTVFEKTRAQKRSHPRATSTLFTAPGTWHLVILYLHSNSCVRVPYEYHGFACRIAGHFLLCCQVQLTAEARGCRQCKLILLRRPLQFTATLYTFASFADYSATATAPAPAGMVAAYRAPNTTYDTYVKAGSSIPPGVQGPRRFWKIGPEIWRICSMISCRPVNVFFRHTYICCFVRFGS